MGLLNTIIGAVTGGRGAGQAAALGAVAELFQNSGGMAGLVQKFESAGLGDVIKGWISTGPNPAISGEQLQAALGSDTVQALAAKVGVNPNDLMKTLSAQLPGVIDQLTPDGQAVDGAALQQALGGLLANFGKR
jgi:uncharacterized protein YidB (DUF937 family)